MSGSDSDDGKEKPARDLVRCINEFTYDAIAHAYARCWNGVLQKELVSEFTEALELRFSASAKTVLDLGCGPGHYAHYFSTLGYRALGIDLSMGMLHETRERSEAGFCMMDICSLGFPSGAFAGAWFCAALMHIPEGETSAALSEVYRVLQPGGVLFVSTLAGSGEAYLPVRATITLAGLNDAGELGDMLRFVCRRNELQLRQALEAAGFGVVRTGAKNDGEWVFAFAEKPPESGLSAGNPSKLSAAEEPER